MTDDTIHAGENLPQVLLDSARRVIEENREAGLRIAVAESCTGGLVSAALTEVPGCSDVFVAGFVTYSNDAKQVDLGVPGDIIDTFGAVSIACVYAMARGALERSKADVAVAISGIAGPGGGTADKPVGTVHLCVAGPEGRKARSIVLPGSRSAVRDRSVTVAMQLLRLLLVGGPEV